MSSENRAGASESLLAVRAKTAEVIPIMMKKARKMRTDQRRKMNQ
jgi:hypothetical protein